MVSSNFQAKVLADNLSDLESKVMGKIDKSHKFPLMSIEDFSNKLIMNKIMINKEMATSTSHLLLCRQ